MTRRLAAAAVAVAVVFGWACGGGDDGGGGGNPPPVTNPGPSGGEDDGGGGGGGRDAGVDAGDAGGGGGIDAGVDAGTDAGTDGGTDAGTPVNPAGPWPTTPVLNYTNKYNTGWVQSVGVDDAYNIWLLDGDRIGVLRPGTTKPVWASGIGQAAPGFGRDKLAQGSTVICGGAAGQAYVGYWTYDLTEPKRTDPADPEYLKGDLDIVQLDGSGNITLLEHMNRSAGTSQPWPKLNIGIRNTNDWTYDEDRSVLVCQKVMKGQFKGEVYIGTNHGVTRIRGLDYDSHRHPVWAPQDNPNSLRIGYSYGLGIGQSGDVLIANEWKVGIATPPPALTDWELFGPTPWKLDTYNEKLNSLEEMDYWRGFQQTVDGNYYLASRDFGLWQMNTTQWSGSANWAKVNGLPTEKLTALAATDDGSLFIGTDASGLWVMDAQKNLSRFTDVSGGNVQQLVYDPSVTPSMLYVLTSDGLFVVRGR